MSRSILSRILACGMALALMIPLCCFAEADSFPVDYTHLKVANPTPLTGHFFTSLWGASTSDLDVQELLHGYKLADYDNGTGRYRINPPVVSGTLVMDDSEGNRTYYFSLCEDLTYSDGSPITARDYAFTLLLMMDPAIAEAGGIPADGSWILGGEEYAAGESRTLKGVRVLSDDLLAVTVKAEALPWFYELSRFRISPYPMREIAPDCQLLDEGEGVCLMPALSGDLLRRTVLDSSRGYMTLPAVVSGPYKIEGYRNGKAHLVLNRRFKGSPSGEIPTIPELTFGGADPEELVLGLETGDLALANKVTKASAVQSAFGLMNRYPGRYRMTAYPRTGLTVLRFMPRSPRVQETAVRQAVRYCLDREGLTKDYTEVYGVPVKGLYGVGQWMVQILEGQAPYPIDLDEETATPAEVQEYERQLAEWQSMSMEEIPEYGLDPKEAVCLLEENGWVLNRFGEPYESGVRYKRMEDGRLVGLDLKVAIPSNMRETLEKHWVPYLEQTGFGIELKDLDLTDLAETYRRNSIEAYDMVLVGEDFTDQRLLNGGYRQFESSGADETPLEALDNEISRMSWEVYHTEKTDLLGFVRKWLDAQIRIAETVPVIPVYSNVYFDFSIAQLRDYRVEDYLSWGDAIVPAWLGEADPEDTAEAAEEQAQTELFEDYGDSGEKSE